MPKKGFRVLKDTDNGFDEFIAGLGSLGRRRARVGIQGNEALAKREGGLTMVQLAEIHEFGAPRAGIPQRSFLRATADQNRDAYLRLLAGIVERFIKRPQGFGTDLGRRAFTVLGEVVRKDVIERIKANIPPPLHPATIARKGEDVALIDEGLLIGSIRSVVE